MYPSHPAQDMSEEQLGVSSTVSSRLPLSGQEKAIAELHETISYLAERLTPVLTPAISRSEPETRLGAEVKEPVSPLVLQLDSNNVGIRSATQALRRIMECLEC